VRAPEQRARAAATEANRDIAGNPAPWLHRPEQTAAKRVEDT